MHFNSHAHVERDKATNEILRKLKISTHTLTWSVTPNIEQITKNMENFNSHAHVERDLHLLRLNCKNLHFNSHAHVERDFIPWFAMTNIKTFQLTRSRGAWRACAEMSWQHGHFNSHAHVERDHGCGYRFRNRIYFNSHAHVERDTSTGGIITAIGHFNSHAHVERDKIINAITHTPDISTHTLTWSVTLTEYRVQQLEKHFNSHAHVERDIFLYSRTAPALLFQLTRSRGAWLYTFCAKRSDVAISTHTLTWSVTLSFL